MANEREPKYFIIPFNGKDELVRAQTKARAVKGLFSALMAPSEKGARLATPDELVRLITTGVKPIDATGEDDPAPQPSGNADPAPQPAADQAHPAAPQQAAPQGAATEVKHTEEAADALAF